MTWFKVDDSLHSHKKAMRAGTEAMGLWVLAGSWSGDQLTDGWVPEYAALRIASNAQELAERLVKAGLWHAGEYDGDKGWWFHDWTEQQPSREDVEKRRKADAERRARWREGKRKARDTAGGASGSSTGDGPGDTARDTDGDSQGASRRDTPRDTDGASRQGSALPDPTRPDPTRGPLFEGDPRGGGRGAMRPPPRDRESAIDACPLRCGEGPLRGYLNGAVCHHDPEQADRNRRGRALVAATLRSVGGRARDEQDQLAELDAVQAPPVDDPPDWHEPDEPSPRADDDSRGVA